MFENIKRFVRWVNEDVHLGKLWGITLVTFGIFVTLALVFRGSQGGPVNVALNLTLLLFLPLYLLSLCAIAARVSRLLDESARFRSWLTGIVLVGLFGWLLFSAIVYPVATLEFFRQEWNRLWDDPFIRWPLEIAGWFFASVFTVIIVSGVISQIVKRLRKNPPQ